MPLCATIVRPFGHRLADAARVIEVVMRDDELGQRFGRHRRARAFDERLRPRLARRRLEHREVIGELEEDGVGAARAVQQPHALADRRRLDGRRRRPRRWRGSHIARRRQIVDGLVDCVLVDVDLVLHDVAEVDDRVVAHRQHHAFDGQISRKRGAKRDVAEVLVVRHPSHPCRQARTRVDGECQLLARLERDVGDLPRRFRARLAHGRRSIERRPHERDGVVHHVDATAHERPDRWRGPCGRSPRALYATSPSRYAVAAFAPPR